jgi:hypothetical protein
MCRVPHIALLFVVSLASTLCAQSTSASLLGRIADSSGAAIAAADVTAVCVERNTRYPGKTNGEGMYLITNLLPGVYKVEMSKPGFKTIVKPDVTLHVQDTINIDYTLPVGAASESITVSGGVPLVNTESTAVSSDVTREQVENMPLNGRSFQSLITLTPGVVLTPTAYNNQGQFSVNGQRSDSNYFTVDGVSANVGVAAGNPINSSAAGSLPALSIAGGTASLISVDAMQEFRIQTSSFAPEFGRTPGAQISIASRPGTNAFHGTAFEYFRNGSLDASDWFTAPFHVTKPDVHQSDFGGVFGGPIRMPGYNGRDKTFFFVSHEGLRLRQPHVAATDVPTLAIRQSAVPSIAPILNAFPIPAANAQPDPLDPGLVSYSGSFSSPSTVNATSFRIDHNVNDKLTIFGRYNYSPSNNSERGSNGLYSLSTSFLTKFTTQTLTAGANWIVTPRVSNEFRFNWSRTSTTDTAVLDNFGGATVPPTSVLFPPGLSGQDAVNIFFIATGTATIVADGKNVDNRLQQFNFVDNVSFIVGKHELKFGVDYRHITTSLSPRAFLEFGLFSSAQEATTGEAVLAESEGDKTNGAVLFQNTGLYAQDTFHVTPRLTIVYGLRWDLNPPPTGLNGFQPYPVVGIEDPATATLGRAGAPLWATTYNNFAPRLGINYALWNQAGWETVIRAGGGTFYDLGSGISGNVLAAGTFPLGATDFFFGVPYPLTGANAMPPTPGGTPVALTGYPGFDSNLKVPRTYQWNLAAQQSLGANQSLSLTYVGAGGRKLLRQENYVIAPGVNSTFSNILFQTNLGGSSYNALQAQFQKRLSKGLQVLASYTYGHSIDNVSNEVTGAFPAPHDPGEDRGPSDFDIRHSFAGSYSYSIPLPSNNRPLRAIFGNWSLDGIVRAYSAPPVDVEAITTTSDVAGYPIPRPNLVAGQPRYIEGADCAAVFGPIGCPGRRGFNPSAFSNAGVIGPSGNVLGQGDLPRNALRGFRLVQFDSAFRRDVRLAERVDVQFRADFFNIFNHPNFASPANILSLPTFGQSISMLGTSLGSGGVFGGQNPIHQIGGPRSIQLALKLQF